MRRLAAVFAGLLIALSLTVSPTSAILNGQPDGNAHPYVALIFDEESACSGAAITPTIVVTAAHCFTSSGQPVYLTFDPDGIYSETFLDDLVTGTWYPDPAFCIGCSGGLPGFDTHDVAVVVLDEPIDLARYAELPELGLVDDLKGKTPIDNVGYGIQDREKDLDEGEAFSRYYAVSNLSRARPRAFADEFIKLSANPSNGKGGICFGDSGGPNLLGGTDIILSVNSFVTNRNCAGVTYSYRIDTEEALSFIGQFL